MVYPAAMNASEAFLVVLRDSHAMLQTAMRDMPSAMAWKQAPGSANPIGAIYAHAVGVEDLYIQQIIQADKPLIWEAGGWSTKLGRATSPNLWEGAEARPINLDDFVAYRRAVYSASELYIAGLADGAFDEAIPFPGRDWSMTRAQLLALVVSHGTGHAGEIAALRGVFGDKGLPF